jgi:hypothetical protein
MEATPLVLQLPRGGVLDRELRAAAPPRVAGGDVVIEGLPKEAGGELKAPDVGQVVLSLPSPEALERESETVRRVIDEAGTGVEPLVVEVEVAEHLREEELAPLLDAAMRSPRAVILRVLRDA